MNLRRTLPIRAKLNETTLELVQDDITNQEVEAVVNAANRSLLGGAGVDGAIHRKAGPALLEACRKLGGCDIGDAKITPGYNLKAQYVIHTVGPVYGASQAAELLSRAYRRSLEVAHENNLKTIAFPAISTGSYGYPVAEAARIALRSVCDKLVHDTSFRLVRFVLFTPAAVSAFADALDELIEARGDLVYA